MRGLGVHENIHVSDAKVTLGVRVDLISSHLIVDKPFSINPGAITGPPKMSLVLAVKSTLALIIKQGYPYCERG